MLKMNRKAYIIIVVTIFFASCGSRQQRQGEQGSVIEEPSYVQEVPEGWTALLDGTTLNGWEIVQYGGEGQPFMKNGILTLPMAPYGAMTGLTLVDDSFPVTNYAIYYEARRVEGNDIFGAMTFPYGDTFATLIVGGWGGATCGISSVDDRDASSNETTKIIHFKDEQWYSIYLHVTPDSIRAVIDDIRVVDLATAGKKIHLRGGTTADYLTFSTFITTGEIRNLRMKKFD